MQGVRTFFLEASRVVFVFLLLVIAFSYGMFQGGFVSWFVFFSVCPFLIYSFILFFVPERVEFVERRFTPTRIEAYDNLVVTVKMKRRTMFPFVYMMLEEKVPVSSQPQKNVGNLRTIQLVGFRKDFEWHYELKNVLRGEYRFEHLEVTFYDFFGWVRQQMVVHSERVIVVYPKVRNIKNVFAPMSLDGSVPSMPFSIVKDTEVATSIRDYQSGDRMSWIHWKSFAKSQTLRTKEFEHPQSSEFAVMIDRSGTWHFDELVEITASLLQMMVKKQRVVSLLSCGEQRRCFSNIEGHRELEQVLHHLALVDANSTYSCEPFIRQERMLNQAGLVLFVTSHLTEEKLFALSQYTKKCLCIVVSDDSVQFAKFQHTIQNVQLLHVSPQNFSSIFEEGVKL